MITESEIFLIQQQSTKQLNKVLRDGPVADLLQSSPPLFSQAFPGTDRQCWQFRITYTGERKNKPTYALGTAWSGDTTDFPEPRSVNPSTGYVNNFINGEQFTASYITAGGVFSDNHYYLVEIGEENDLGMGLLQWTLTYSQLPIPYITMEPYNFDYPSYYQAEMDKARSKAPTQEGNAVFVPDGVLGGVRKAIQWNGFSVVIRDYFRTNNPFDIDMMGSRIKSGMDLQEGDQLMVAWTGTDYRTINGRMTRVDVPCLGYSIGFTVPTPQQYQAMGVNFSGNVGYFTFSAPNHMLAESDTRTCWKGNIYERTRRIIPHA